MHLIDSTPEIASFGPSVLPSLQQTETVEPPTSVAEEAVQPLFAQELPSQSVLPCSWNKCSRGHKFPPALVIANCPACGTQYVAVQKVQCPYCNEPVVETSLRSDFLPRGGGLFPRCKGAQTPFETLDIQLQRTGWEEAQEKFQEFKG